MDDQNSVNGRSSPTYSRLGHASAWTRHQLLHVTVPGKETVLKGKFPSRTVRPSEPGHRTDSKNSHNTRKHKGNMAAGLVGRPEIAVGTMSTEHTQPQA